jgi:ABC-2 type transport system permease protein
MNWKTIRLLVQAYWLGNKPITSALERLSFKRKGSRSPLLTALIALMLIIMFIYFSLLLGLNYYSYQTLGILVEEPLLGLFVASALSFIVLLLFSFTSIHDFLYTAKDILLVRTLKVGDASTAISRLILLYLHYAPLYWFLTLPALVVGAFIQGFSLYYVLASLPYLLLGPMLPLCCSVLFAIAIIRASRGKRFRFLEETAPMVLMVLFIVGISAAFTRNLGQDSLLDFQYESMMVTLAPILKTLQKQLPLFSLQAAQLFSGSSVLLVTAINGAVLLVTCLVVVRTYQTNISKLLSNQSTRSRRRKEIAFKANSQMAALFKRELVVIRSNSSFLFELVGELFIPVILILVYMLTGVMDEMAGMAEVLTAFPFFEQLVFLTMLLVANLGMLSSTSVSRQGRMFVFDRLYPVPASVYVQAKLLFHFCLVGIPNLIYLSLSLLFFKVSLFHLVWMAPLSLCLILLAATLHLCIDYHNPKLDWTLAQQAMKSNTNGLIGLGLSFVLEVVAAGFLILPVLLDLPFIYFAAILFVLALFVLRHAYRLAVNLADQALSR